MKVYDLGNTQWKQLTPTTSQQANIDTVAANNTNINHVAGQISPTNNIATVANDSSDIQSLAGITNLNNLANSYASVVTAANNLSDINSFANIYLGPSSSAPTQDPDGSALDAGDLYFDTTNDELRVYYGSSWQGGVTATGNLVTKADIGAASGVPGTGSSGQYLQTNGSGTLSWQSIATVVSETDRIIASNYTLTTGKNAMSVGDVTIASGATLTIPANAFYKVI